MAPDPAVPGHAAAVVSALEDWDTGTVWPNFGPVHDAASARRAYGAATRQRLAAIVAAHDPDGVLTLGRWTRECD